VRELSAGPNTESPSRPCPKRAVSFVAVLESFNLSTIMSSTNFAPAVYGIDEASAEDAFAPIVLAFSTDPAARWSWPDPADYLRNMPLAARAFGGKSFALGTAFGIDRFAGVALWLPPGVSSDEEALTGLIERTAPASIQQDAASVFEQMASFHPKEPHWYLPLIGVDPTRQGQRLGDKLMAHALGRCDADRCLPIWNPVIRSIFPSTNGRGSR
jgi:ribosomal protein S18 acetylase RimI-like enzyme